MIYTSKYESKLGKILLASDGTNLTGLWIEGQKYYFGDHRKHPDGQDQSAESQSQRQYLRQTRGVQPHRQHQGPHRPEDDRNRRAGGTPHSR